MLVNPQVKILQLEKSRTQVCVQERRGNYYNNVEGLIWKMKRIDIHWNKIEFPACICKEAESDSSEKDGRALLAAFNCFPSSTLHEYSISPKSREWIRYTHSVGKSFPVKSPPC